MIFTSLNLVKNLMEKTHTNKALSVVVNVVDKIYEIGRKVTDDLKKNLKIVFDEYLPNGIIERCLYSGINQVITFSFLSPDVNILFLL
ncbi:MULTISPECIES: ISAzo13-like element transposase-related protein [unclassified Microcoleus]|uniref:ISAzo13-like element transposase-related protein n=1 Tax=unclassified Microcoleus TaxID=2642155 RepID=UPI002FD2B25E